MATPFLAVYTSKCADCGEWIIPGDVVRFGPDGLTHEDCDGGPDPIAVTSTVCPVCWLLTPCEHTT